MRYNQSVLAAALISLAVIAGTPAQAQVDETVGAAMAELAAGNAEAAYRRLAPLASQRAGTPDYDYALGLAAADSGRPAEAIVALQRVLSMQPENAQARAELARAYALAGDIDTARQEFDTVVQDPTIPDPVRQRFDRLVRDYGRQITGGSDVSGFADVSTGFDSNVNSATDLTQITIPLFAAFGPGVLGAGARAQDDGYLEANVGVSGVTAVSRQARVFGSVLGNLRDNFDSDAFDQLALTGTAGGAYTLANRDVVSASGQVQNFWLSGSSFRQSYGGVAQYTHRLMDGRAMSLSGEYFRLEYDGDPLRDADRYAGSISFIGRTFVASATLGHEETRREAGDHLSHDFARASVGFEVPMGNRYAVIGGLSAQARAYDRDDPLFLVEREDEQVDASVGLKFRLTEALYLRPRLTYTRNWSNVALYDFERVTASVGLRVEF
ncbi:MAG: tetratricopeptide repeat protein [Brevundimonas sp.]